MTERGNMQANRILPLAFTSAVLVLGSNGTAWAQMSPGQQSPTPQQQQTRGLPTNLPDNTPVKVDDKSFLKTAAEGGLTEVELGKLAVQKSSNEAVKQFGQKMIDDHSKANDALKQVASKENVEVPDSLNSKSQAVVDKLSKLSGPAFDKAYMKDMLRDHEEDVAAFQGESQNGSDPATQQFAANVLPTIQEHLHMAKDLNKNLKNEK